MELSNSWGHLKATNIQCWLVCSIRWGDWVRISSRPSPGLSLWTQNCSYKSQQKKEDHNFSFWCFVRCETTLSQAEIKSFQSTAMSLQRLSVLKTNGPHLSWKLKILLLKGKSSLHIKDCALYPLETDNSESNIGTYANDQPCLSIQNQKLFTKTRVCLLILHSVRVCEGNNHPKSLSSLLWLSVGL